MAYLAKLGAQVDELIAAVSAASGQGDHDGVQISRDAVIRVLRQNTFPRTNQFEVEEYLDGFEERFSVAGRDGLATALGERRRALQAKSTRWTPEILQLLLELSDQPVKKSRLEDLELLRPCDQAPELTLRWDEIAEEDGWGADRALWKTINYAETSDDEEYGDAQSESSESDDTSLSSHDARHERSAQDLLLPDPDTAILEPVHQSQAWRYEETTKDPNGRPLKLSITEFQVLREALFMLQGLKNNLFNAQCEPAVKYQMSSTSWHTFSALLDSISESGYQIFTLRRFLATSGDTTPLQQVFRDSIRQRLLSFDRHVSTIQARFIDIKQDTPVSVIAVMEELKPAIKPMYALSRIVQKLTAEQYAYAFRYLELLFDAVCTAQLEGDDNVHRYLGDMFFQCFDLYLRPIRKWMAEGDLIPGDKSFFVSASAAEVPPNKIWERKYKLRRTKQGVLHAPNFLRPAVSRIFTTGKSIVVLKRLGKYQRRDNSWDVAEPPLTFAAVCPRGSELAPFSELFNNAFDIWMKSRHHTASATLQRILFDSCGLWTSLDALQHLHLMADGSCADAFTFPIFEYLDNLNPSWRDRFTLAEFAREAFGTRLDQTLVSAVVEIGSEPDDVAARQSVRIGLSKIKLRYRLSWPVQLVISGESLTAYDALFTLLLQVRRAVYALNRNRILNELSDVARTDEAPLYYTLRSRLLWFCTTFHTYLTSLVLAPSISAMQDDLRTADDVDAMIRAHGTFCKRLIEEACLGAKLEPIRECILDLFDLAVKLEDGRRGEAARLLASMNETSRLSLMSSPQRHDPLRQPRRGVYVSEAEQAEAEMTFIDAEDTELAVEQGDTYLDLLQSIGADFDRYLRFIIGGLKGVARASSGAAAGKWDMLAEMLETGMRDQRAG
ncbi:uncharacterized protein E0L32_009106 [Thyridium curvatum]|uniref:Spindle pole body component n=1 Tax=Thyridium curvatum TaxID=1093900 RepID=A0A507APD4_9PEZI|nr:uncharacterized protein E0L32_009106 [Thyridium curvatum]TPX09633.1 hypothetical protein E0L32_009106 [Thyridium curvatum]